MPVSDEVASALEIRRTQSLAALVQQEIERLILDGEIRVGERLNENALAARLGVSRGPIREAARGLEKAGLVRLIVNRGAFVREIGVEEAAELYDLRAALFGLACGHVAEARDPRQVERLSQLVERMEAARREGDAPAYYPLNLEFHRAVIAFAGRPRLEGMYASLVKEAHLFRRHALSTRPNMTESNDEHRRIVAAIAAGRATEARRLGETHVLHGKRRFLTSIERPPREEAAGGAASGHGKAHAAAAAPRNSKTARQRSEGGNR